MAYTKNAKALIRLLSRHPPNFSARSGGLCKQPFPRNVNKRTPKHNKNHITILPLS
jgi:hypothetical protein